MNQKYSLGNLSVVFIFFLAAFSACVPVKKTKYLQAPKGAEVYKIYQILDYEYVLKPGDNVNLIVNSLTADQFDFLQAKGATEEGGPLPGFTITNEGEIELPVIGTIKLAGMTLEEAEAHLKGLLDGYLKNPVVRLNLQNFNFTILGEVNGPGKYTSPDPKLSIYEAIGMAGDLGPFADRANVMLVRANQNGEARIRRLNLLEDAMLENEYFYIESNDILYVSPLKAKGYRENQLWAITTILGTIGGLGFVLIQLLR